MTKDTQVDRVSGEITLYDLIAWEPRLHPIAPQPGSSHWRSLTTIDVDWILTARSTQPILPSIRGGELIVLPDRIVREIGVPFAALMREISSQPIAGILTDHPGPPDTSTGIAVIRAPVVDSETERDLNRLLTNGRRDALQSVAELDRAIAEAGAHGSRPSELIDQLSKLIEIPITVQTPGSTTLFTTASSRDEPEAGSDRWLRQGLRNGYTAWLGPIPPAKHALARFSLDHVRNALQRAMDSSLSLTPRGTARVAALNAILKEPITADTDTLAQKALHAGIPPDRTLRVSVTSSNLPEAEIRKSLQQLGDLFDAGELDGHHLWLLASRHPTSSPVHICKPADGWIAVSAAIESPGTLPHATRQARYMGLLVANRLITSTAAMFHDLNAVGIYALLYPEWGAESQVGYRNQQLGPLLENDPRGQLVETLATYLDHGGSQRQTAESLGIHRNTLTYRLRQIGTALPVNLEDPHTRLSLHVAVAIHRILTL